MTQAALPKSNTSFRAHPRGFIPSEVVPAFDGRIDGLNVELDTLITEFSGRFDDIEKNFRPSAQVAAKDELQAKLYPKFNDFAKHEVRYIKHNTREQVARAAAPLSLAKTDNNDAPGRIFKNNTIHDLLNHVTADLKPDQALTARSALLAASAAKGDRSMIRYHDCLPRIVQLALFRDEDIDNARRLYSESQDPEAFQDLRRAVQYLPQARFNLQLAAKTMRMTHRWHTDPEGESAFNAAIADVRNLVGTLPEGSEDLESVMIRYKLLPIGKIDLA